jgi:hypothetical protein
MYKQLKIILHSLMREAYIIYYILVEIVNYIILNLLFITLIFLCYWFFQIIIKLPQIYWENNIFDIKLTADQLQAIFQFDVTKESLFKVPLLLKPILTYFYIFPNKITSIITAALVCFLLPQLYVLSYFVYRHLYLNLLKWVQLTFFLLFLIIYNLSTFECLVEYLPLIHILCIIWFLLAFIFILIIFLNYPSTKQMVAIMDEKIINFYEIIIFFIKKIFNK